ncbi:MAG: aldo/keto reductase [Planctomycetes bacterium]|nr:aldo/keto reductase [Planctomycetota bacterium]MCW8135967.1 aldo/keto reductase [Planctomycetota bacterium]
MDMRPLFSGGPMVSAIGISLSAPPTASLPLHQLAILAPQTQDPAANGESLTIAAIERAVALGVNLIDSDWITANGHAQELLGRALARLDRQRLVITSKAGPRLTFKGTLTLDNSRANLINQCHDSLFRLKLSHIDLYQVHWPDGTAPQQTARGLEDLVSAGLTRFSGVCNYTAQQAAALAAHTHLVCAQGPLTLLNRTALTGLLPWCRENGMAFLAADPLHSGLLAGRFTAEQEFTDEDRDEWFTQPRFGVAVKIAAALAGWATARGMTASQAAVAWALAQPGVTSVLVPARSPDEVTELVGATRHPLSPADVAELEQLAQAA